MSNKIKRFRQTSIIRFTFAKKPKMEDDLVENNNKQFERATSSRYTKIIMSSNDSDKTSNDVCQAAEDSMEVITKNIDRNPEPSCSNTEIDYKISDSSPLPSSADLFPEESPSLGDYSVPSSSNSDELFPNSADDESSENATTSESNDSDEQEQVSYLNRTPDCCLPLPKLEPLENHTILYSIFSRPGDIPHPYPKTYRDKWDQDHVRMPCSPLNRYPIEDHTGEKHIGSRWNLICQSLRSDIESSQDLEEAIMKYNSQYIGKWNFMGLHDFINKHLSEGERDHFFDVILPVMIEMALDLPNICTQPVPLLKRGMDHKITISQKQIGCLLLNAFFCTFPRRNVPNRHSKQRWNCEYARYPEIHFNKLFFGTKNGTPRRNAEKLKCLLNYFRRITSEEPTGTVTFHRQSLHEEDLPEWHKSNRGIRTAVVKSSGFIETDGYGMLQVDFANKFVGGGVLGQGCVQEEIRFITCPELIISRLFVESLGNNEVLFISGVEQYNKFSGYADSFKWEGNFKDETPRDMWGRRCTQLVAMDAISFRDPDLQYKVQYIKRELNKAYCAFYENISVHHLPAIATGNWGCGAFKGNPNLKFLIQLMAASQTGRNLLYFTFGNKKLKRELQNMYDFLSDKNLAVGDVWRLLMRYDESLSNEAKGSNLYDFIYAQFPTKENCRNSNKKCSKDLNLDDSDEKAAQKLIEDLSNDSSTENDDIT